MRQNELTVGTQIYPVGYVRPCIGAPMGKSVSFELEIFQIFYMKVPIILVLEERENHQVSNGMQKISDNDIL